MGVAGGRGSCRAGFERGSAGASPSRYTRTQSALAAQASSAGMTSASRVMMVRRCSSPWKYLILLVYTAALFAAGQWSLHRAGLRQTGAVLLALTVLLVPIAFLALHWVGAGGEPGSGWGPAHFALLAVTFTFSVTAAP